MPACHAGTGEFDPRQRRNLEACRNGNGTVCYTVAYGLCEFDSRRFRRATVAQLVERCVANAKVGGSSPLSRSMRAKSPGVTPAFQAGHDGFESRSSLHRSVAQSGSALGSGPRGRWFNSSHSDHLVVVGKVG